MPNANFDNDDDDDEVIFVADEAPAPASAPSHTRYKVPVPIRPNPQQPPRPTNSHHPPSNTFPPRQAGASHASRSETRTPHRLSIHPNRALRSTGHISHYRPITAQPASSPSTPASYAEALASPPSTGASPHQTPNSPTGYRASHEAFHTPRHSSPVYNHNSTAPYLADPSDDPFQPGDRTPHNSTPAYDTRPAYTTHFQSDVFYQSGLRAGRNYSRPPRHSAPSFNPAVAAAVADPRGPQATAERRKIEDGRDDVFDAGVPLGHGFRPPNFDMSPNHAYDAGAFTPRLPYHAPSPVAPPGRCFEPHADVVALRGINAGPTFATNRDVRGGGSDGRHSLRLRSVPLPKGTSGGWASPNPVGQFQGNSPPARERFSVHVEARRDLAPMQGVVSNGVRDPGDVLAGSALGSLLVGADGRIPRKIRDVKAMEPSIDLNSEDDNEVQGEGGRRRGGGGGSGRIDSKNKTFRLHLHNPGNRKRSEGLAELGGSSRQLKSRQKSTRSVRGLNQAGPEEVEEEDANVVDLIPSAAETAAKEKEAEKAAQVKALDEAAAAVAASAKEEEDQRKKEFWAGIETKHLRRVYNRGWAMERVRSFKKHLAETHQVNIGHLGLTTLFLREQIPNFKEMASEMRDLGLEFNQIDDFEEDVFEEKSHLNSISLECNLLRHIPLALTLFTNLVHLDLCSNKIVHVPEEVYNLRNLTRLVLAKNCIKELPCGISKLTKLRILRLDSNELESLPEDLGVNHEKLIMVSVSRNKKFCCAVPQSMRAVAETLDHFFFEDTGLSDLLPKKIRDGSDAAVIELVAGKSQKEVEEELAEIYAKAKANAQAKRRASSGEQIDVTPKGGDRANDAPASSIGAPASSIAKSKPMTAREEKDSRRISPAGRLRRSKGATPEPKVNTKLLEEYGIGVAQSDTRKESTRRSSAPGGKKNDDAVVHLDEEDDDGG